MLRDLWEAMTACMRVTLLTPLTEGEHLLLPIVLLSILYNKYSGVLNNLLDSAELPAYDVDCLLKVFNHYLPFAIPRKAKILLVLNTLDIEYLNFLL